LTRRELAVRTHPMESMADQFGRITELTSPDSGTSGASLLRTELNEHMLHGGVEGDVSSSNLAFSQGAPVQDEGPSELRTLLSERQELLLVNQALRESCAEWGGAIRRVVSLLRGATAERNRLVQHLTLLQQIRMSDEVSASALSHLMQDDSFAGLLESSTATSANSLAPELHQVAAPRMSASAQQRSEEAYFEATPLQTPPLTRINQSPIAMQLSEDPEAELAERAMVGQQNDGRQGGRRRNRRRQQRQRQMETPNGQHQTPFQVTVQLNREQAQVPHIAPDTRRQFFARVAEQSNERQFSQQWQRHNLHPSIMNSAGTSALHRRAILVEDKFPKAAAAA